MIIEIFLCGFAATAFLHAALPHNKNRTKTYFDTAFIIAVVLRCIFCLYFAAEPQKCVLKRQSRAYKGSWRKQKMWKSILELYKYVFFWLDVAAEPQKCVFMRQSRVHENGTQQKSVHKNELWYNSICIQLHLFEVKIFYEIWHQISHPPIIIRDVVFLWFWQFYLFYTVIILSRHVEHITYLVEVWPQSR